VVAIVITDASPLIGLARVSGVSWLKDLFGVVLIPSVVADEVLTGHFPDQEALIQEAIEAGWLRLAADIETGPALPDLDEGEAASIRLALSFGPASSALLLIDERACPASTPLAVSRQSSWPVRAPRLSPATTWGRRHEK
jgi:predicted nucleic acid-binding protein